MAKPNGVIVLPPLYRPGGSAQYSDTIATDDTGTWNTYLMPDGTYSGIGFTLKAPSTAVLKLQASCNSLAEIQGDTTAGLAAAIAAGTFTGWTQAAVGSVVTFTAASTGLRSGVYDIGFTNGARGTMVLTNPGMTGVNATFLLTITQGASAPGNVGVALNGGSNVNTAVLLGDTAAQVATKIAASVFAGYVVTNPSPGVVLFTATVDGPQIGANTVTPNATGVLGAVVPGTLGIAGVAAIATLTITAPSVSTGTADVTLNGTRTDVALTAGGSAATWVDVPSATSTGGTGYVGWIAGAVTALRTVIATALAAGVGSFAVRVNANKY